MFVNRVLYISIITTISLSANWSDSLNSAWEETKKISESVINTTLEKSQELSKDTMNLMYKFNLNDTKCTTNKKLEKEHLANVWDDFLIKSTNGLEKLNKIDNAPEASLLNFGDDKDSLREDFNSILNDIMTLLVKDSKTISCIEQLKKLKQEIIDENINIISYKEARITAPIEDSFKSTKGDYTQSITISKEKIGFYSKKIKEIKLSLLKNLNLIGLNLSMPQLEILLLRVDSDDIVGISIIFDTSKSITKELEKLLSDSGEDIEISRRYYGMNLILSEMIVYTQSIYMKQLNEKYIPKLKSIIIEVQKIRDESQRLLNRAENKKDEDKINIYSTNIKSLELTIKTAKLYVDNLKLQRLKVKKAYNIARENLSLTRNTYKTVAISSKLLSLIKSTQKSFSHLMNMQLPEIVPFKNLKMQKEYKKLTEEILKK